MLVREAGKASLKRKGVKDTLGAACVGGNIGPGWGPDDASRQSECFRKRSVRCLQCGLKEESAKEGWRHIFESFGVCSVCCT